MSHRLRPQGRRRLHRLDGRRRPVSSRRRGRWPTAAACRCSARSTSRPQRTPLSVDESGRLLADLQRPGDGGREAPIRGWQAFGSYTLSKAYGLQPSSGTTRRARRSSTVVAAAAHRLRTRSQRSHQRARPAAQRSPAHVPLMGSVDVPRTGFVVAANLQHFSGKPWAAARRSLLPQERRSASCSSRAARAGCRRNRCSTCACRGPFALGGVGRIELLLDVLNAAQRRGGGEPGDRDQMTRRVQSELRSAGQLRGSAPRDAQRQAEPGPVAFPTSHGATPGRARQPLHVLAACSRFLDRRDTTEKTDCRLRNTCNAPGDAARGSARPLGLAVGHVTATASMPTAATAGEPDTGSGRAGSHTHGDRDVHALPASCYETTHGRPDDPFQDVEVYCDCVWRRHLHGHTSDFLRYANGF